EVTRRICPFGLATLDIAAVLEHLWVVRQRLARCIQFSLRLPVIAKAMIIVIGHRKMSIAILGRSSQRRLGRLLCQRQPPRGVIEASPKHLSLNPRQQTKG